MLGSGQQRADQAPCDAELHEVWPIAGLCLGLRHTEKVRADVQRYSFQQGARMCISTDGPDDRMVTTMT